MSALVITGTYYTGHQQLAVSSGARRRQDRMALRSRDNTRPGSDVCDAASPTAMHHSEGGVASPAIMHHQEGKKF